MNKSMHIVVDPATRRCLCGMYGDRPLYCQEIMERARVYDLILALVLETLLVDCSEQFVPPPKPGDVKP